MKAYEIVASFVCCLLTSCINVVAQDEGAAAKAATQFAQTAFVSRDYERAHELLIRSGINQFTTAKLSEAIARMHPKTFPTEVLATDFEPIPGQRAMNIYLKGRGEGEDFYYRLVMVGDATSGYRVSGLYRGNRPSPSPNKRPLRP
jgi:hypothetical protein